MSNIPDIILNMGFDKAIAINSDVNVISKSQIEIIEEVENFGIDGVYFCRDEKKNHFPAVFLKKVDSFNLSSLKEISNAHKKIWNYKKVIFFYVYSETEIRIYNCAEKPLVITETNFDFESELKELEIESYSFNDTERLRELRTLFSTIAVDTGTIWTLEEAYELRKKITLTRRVDKYLVESLINTANQLKSHGLEIGFIHKVILRSLFLLYLEDRGATDEKFYSEINKNAKSYFDILNSTENTYTLFSKLEEHFNGNIFALEDNEEIYDHHLQIIKKCFISGNDATPQVNLFENWRIFDFSIIQIELLSEIYENFLSEINPEFKNKSGTYYTPPSLVELILNEKLPVTNQETDFNIKILDPSCGSGIFLVQSFKRLVKRYENKHNKKLTDFHVLKQLLTDNIYGVELNSQAIKVAAFSLYLALVDNLNPKTLWQNKSYKLPYLINNLDDDNLKHQGNNLFCRDTISENPEFESISFDLIVGNPPFGTSDLLPSIKTYVEKHNFAAEMVLPFLHKATEFSPDGQIALIFNTKVLTNTNSKYQNFRYWLFNDCYVEKIYNFSILRKTPKNFGGQLFGSATGPISIIFYRKNAPKSFSDKITYYAPKTYIKSNVIEGVVIDSTDVKFLPREECQKPDSKVWKITMWGGMNDFNLIGKLMSKYESFKSYLDNNNVEYGSGLHPKENETNKLLAIGKHIGTSKIRRYFTHKDLTSDIEKEYRGNNLRLFSSPIAVLKEGITNKEIVASFFDYDVFFNKAVYGFSANDKNKLKSMVIVFNSSLAKYFFFLTSSSWGIERDRIVLSEYLRLPYSELDPETLEKLDFSQLNFNIHKSIFDIEKSDFNSEYWDKMINTSYELDQTEEIILNDTLQYTIDLFHRQENSIALLPINNELLKEYCTLFAQKLNDFLFEQEIFANATIYDISKFNPIMMVKISFDKNLNDVAKSPEFLEKELKDIDKHLWDMKAPSIYFRKKLNYKTDNSIYLIRPNQRRYWSKSMALEDASELILEILNES